MSKNQKSPEQIVDEALSKGDERSPVYRQGIVDLLRFKLEGVPIPRRYQPGTVEFDAYYSGNDRGWVLWRQMTLKPDSE